MSIQLTRSSAAVRRSSAAVRRWVRHTPVFQDAALIGVAGFVISFAASWVPSFWGDEAASVMSAQRSLPSLFTMLGHIDAVHGSYYLFLHAWIELFGASPLSVRLPSAISVGLSVAGVVVLTNRLATRRIAIIAGIVCAVLPRITYMGEEARAYAFCTTLAVWLTLLLVELLAREATNWMAWLGYAALFTLGVYTFLYFGLLGVAHGIVVFRSAKSRHLVTRWLIAASLAVAASTPIIFWGFQERGQIAFMSTENAASFGLITVDQWFGNVALAVVAWLLLAVGIAHTFMSTRRTKRLSMIGNGQIPSILTVVVPWFAMPALILFIANQTVIATYTIRYLSMSAPAVAILIALGIGVSRNRWLSGFLLFLVIALAVPSYVAQRMPNAKPGEPDWQQVSELLGQSAQPGDAVVFDDTIRPSRRVRQAIHVYPDGFQGLKDVTLNVPFYDTTGIRDTAKPLAEVTPRLDGIKNVWLLESRGSRQNSSGSDRLILENLGYTQVKATPVHTTIVYLFQKTGP